MIGPAGAARLSGRTARLARPVRARNRPWSFPAAAGLLLVVAVALLASAGPAVAAAPSPFTPVGPPLQPPGGRFWMGTDDLGRDIFTGVAHGARVSSLVGLIAAGTAAVLGTLVGGVAGFYGRAVGDLLIRLTEAVQVVPRFFLAVLVAALFGPSVWYLALLLGLTFWPGTARLLRAQVLSLREREFVLAARAVGLSEAGVLARHVLPNAASVVVVSAALQIGAAILVEAGLGFLGLSDRTVMSWGTMLINAQPFLRTAWWMSMFPGAALALAVLGANLLSDGLQTAFDPRRSRPRR